MTLIDHFSGQNGSLMTSSRSMVLRFVVRSALAAAIFVEPHSLGQAFINAVETAPESLRTRASDGEWIHAVTVFSSTSPLPRMPPLLRRQKRMPVLADRLLPEPKHCSSSPLSVTTGRSSSSSATPRKSQRFSATRRPFGPSSMDSKRVPRVLRSSSFSSNPKTPIRIVHGPSPYRSSVLPARPSGFVGSMNSHTALSLFIG